MLYMKTVDFIINFFGGCFNWFTIL